MSTFDPPKLASQFKYCLPSKKKVDILNEGVDWSINAIIEMQELKFLEPILMKINTFC